ncbi:6-pyruvoyl trahydropterin synthase family protein [Tenacibaculum piscium]|uniref:6-pyruvoyl trahydropterin synthase family protein n=1 Tax=Tenacibaculum piscium TaxID=1458515 RepID=UPI001F2DCAA2|nr:6-carboxytetrahydropterin synthase [Tenacibaculum piscium]
MKKIAITRKEHFNSAHRLHNLNWSIEKNKEVFGKCNNENYHGHNYDLEVTIIGAINPDTGYVIDTKILSNHIKNEILEPFDHKNLNLDTEDFEFLNPTVENIAVVIYNKLKKVISNDLEIKIKLYETARNFVEYPY